MKKESIIRDNKLQLVINSTEDYLSINIKEGETYHTESLVFDKYQINELIKELIEHKNNALGIKISD